MIGDNRARIKTEEKESNDNEKKEMLVEGRHRDQNAKGDEEGLKGLELRKADIIRKRLMLTNKAV